jgi:hypothetical protein
MPLILFRTHLRIGGIRRNGRREITKSDLTNEESFVAVRDAVGLCRKFGTFQRSELVLRFFENCLPSYNDIHPGWINSLIPLACAECDDSLPFSGASSIPLCYIPIPSALFSPISLPFSLLHFAVYVLTYLSALLFPNSYIILFWGIRFSSILCKCPNQRNQFNVIVSVIVGYSKWIRSSKSSP